MLVVALALLGGMLVTTPAHAAGTGSVTGKVLGTIDGVTAPQDAYVGLTPVDADGFDTGPEVDAWTDATGRYSATGLADGNYEMRILPNPQGREAGLGYEYYNNRWSPYGSTLVKVAGGQVSLPDIVLEQVGWVTGTVRDAQGNPLPNTWVMVMSSETSGGYGLETDANGRYDTRDGEYTGNIIPGSYHLEARVDRQDDEQGYYPDTATVQVASNRATVQDFVIEPQRTAVFTLLDTDGTPLADAPLRLLLQRTPGGPWESPQYGPIQTDAQGRYFFYETTNYKIKFLLPKGYTGTGVPEYWDGPSGDGSYALEDAATLTWDGQPMLRRYTVRLGAAPTIKPGTPTIAGEMKVGQTLTADPGTWAPGGVALDYQWLAGGNPIAGATERQFTIPASLKGTYSISVRVTGRKAGETPVEADSDYLVGPVADGPAPVEFDTPTISGTPQVGATLTAEPGDWGPAGVDLTYAWKAGNTAVGSDQPTYQPTAADLGKTITVTVTGALTGYTSVARTSVATQPVAAQEIVAGTPTITGTPQVGATLTADPGDWAPEDVALAYQWHANNTDITGADQPTYTPTTADIGKRITVSVTGSREHSADVTRTSSATEPVAAEDIVPGTPTITGVARAGKTLTVDAGDWSPEEVELSYQWLADGVEIDGATGTTLELTNALAGKRITARVTGTSADQSLAETSAPTAAVVGVLSTAKPKIKGKPKVGKKLTAKPGSWGPGEVKLSYQWLRNGKAIKGATGKKYKLTKKDKGKKLQVRVTGKKPGFATEKVTSAKTKKVKK